MSNHQKPNLDGDGANSCYSSSFQRTVVLRDWWLIKCSNEFEGKRFGVAGTETSFESRAMRVFTSSPIIKALDVFTLQASNGICITLRGFLNKERVVKNGFKPEICREFIFGFPPCWERICNDCFQRDSFDTDINTVPSTIDKACSPILSPCKYSRGSQEDNPAESRDKSTVTETNIAEINSKDGSRARDKKTARRKSLRLQLKSGGKSAEGERKLESSKVQNTTNDGDHGSEGLNKAKTSDLEEDECEAINNEENYGSKVQNCNSDEDHGSEDVNKAKSSDVEKDECEAINNEDNYDSKDQNCTSDEDHGSEGLDKAKRIDVEKDECEAINDELISPADGCGKKHSGTVGVEKLTSKNATRESLTSEQRKGKRKETKTSVHSLSKDLNNSCKPEKNRKSKKSEKTVKSDSNVIEPMNNSGSEVKEAEEDLSWGKTKRKIDFDVEVTPEKESKKQKTNVVSTDSLGQKRSRSGRLLVSSLEFWRNQIPVYDMDRNLIQVREGSETKSAPSKVKGSNSRKPRS